MVSFHSIVAAALAAVCIPAALAYPTDCDWLGCGLQTPLGEASYQKQTIAAGIKPSDIVTNLQRLTAKAQAIQAPAQSISLVNGPLVVVGLGPFPKIVQQYVDIISTATTDISSMNGLDPIKGDDADNVYNAYRDFARVNEYTFNILIGKAGLFQTINFIGDPMAAVLRQVEGIYDSYTFALIDAVSSRSVDIQGVAGALDQVEDRVINSYQGVAM